jgi:pimeloyl-ACP methyl ester carboxylesterase
MESSRRLPGVDGIEIQVREWSREGTPLLFLHGFANDSHVWDEIAPVLAPHYRVLALDHRGHGDSAWDPEGRYDQRTMAADVLRVLDQLGIERLVLVGHSMGGRVSMLVAAEAPEKIAGLVIVDSAPELDRRGTTRIATDARKGERSFASLADYEAVLSHQYPVTPSETLARLARHWTRENDEGRYELKMDAGYGRARMKGNAEEMLARASEDTERMWKGLEKLECPALVVRGAASDVMSADIADRMADDVLKNATLEVIARAGHSVMLDNAAEFERAICRYALGE